MLGGRSLLGWPMEEMNMKWSQLPDELTTEQVIEFASSMNDGEDITVSTPITDFLALNVSMGNKPLEGVGVSLVIEEAEEEGMYGFASVEGFYPVISGGELPSQGECLNMHDVVKLFRLGGKTRWELINHGAMVGGLDGE